MVFKPEQARNTLWVLFENDVKKYGIQTHDRQPDRQL